MAVHEISVTNKRECDRFIAVERAAIADEPLAIREIAGDVHKRLQGRSPFFEEMEHAAFLATADGHDVARCMAMINRRWQRDKGDAAGFVGYFAALRGAAPSRRWRSCSPPPSCGSRGAAPTASSRRSTAPRYTASGP